MAGALLFFVTAAFWIRYRVTRSPISAVLALMATGWFWLVAVINGDVPRGGLAPLRWFALGFGVLLAFGAFQVSEWRRWRAQNRRLGGREVERRKEQRRAEDRQRQDEVTR